MENIQSTSSNMSPSRARSAENNCHSKVDFLSLKHLADVSLKCDDLEIKCHKIKLAEASPVFFAMFALEDSQENTKNLVEIRDTSPDIFRSMIAYIYNHEPADELLNDVQRLKELYILSDRYDVASLRKSCAVSLIFGCEESNCLDMLRFCHQFADDVLRTALVYEIGCHFDSISQSTAWKDLLREDPSIIHMLMTGIVDEMRNMADVYFNVMSSKGGYKFKNFVRQNKSHILFSRITLPEPQNGQNSDSSDSESDNE